MATRTRVAVVTGAGRGIGRATATLLTARGYRVVRADLDATAADVAADVRDPAALKALARHAATLGDVTVWVNNAGVLRSGPAWTHTDLDVRLLVETNLLGVVYGCRGALSVMTGGDIVNIASMSAHGPVPGIAVYAATKAAVRNFTVGLAGDLRQARRPVRVHALCPDGADTPMLAERRDEAGTALIFTAPRLLREEEVAAAVVRLVGRRRLVRSVPNWRAGLLVLADRAPRVSLALLPLLHRIGDRRRRRTVSR